ncbi:MAG: YvcK family protein [Caldilineales bacterium]|nr:YvcK family protein [Caldilineales bacterium]
MNWFRNSRTKVTWLTPGLRVKRWLLLLIVGVTILSLGLAYLLRAAYAYGMYPPIVYWLTLQFLPRPVRALLFGLVGITITVWALVELNRSLLAPFIDSKADVAERLYRHRRLGRGLRVVCIGGGTGMPSTLRGLRQYTDHITAIVTVADDGGSSGRLRVGLGMLPPGDFRNNLAALSEAETTMTQLFQYRFASAEAGLDGHAFGNLYLAAMTAVTGSFESGLLESSKVLAVKGRVLPSTLELVQLNADVVDEDGRLERIRGESMIPTRGAGRRIHKVYLDPETPRAYPEAIHAILGADIIVAGPGSLYTSVLPNLLVPEIAQAVRSSRAVKVYVCNIATQPGETDDYDVDDHVQAIFQHAGRGVFHYVLANSVIDEKTPAGPNSEWVQLPKEQPAGYRLVASDLRDKDRPWRHDPNRVAHAIMRIYEQVMPGHGDIV